MEQLAWFDSADSILTRGENWQITIEPDQNEWRYHAHCFGHNETKRAATEEQAKTDALAWVAMTLKFVTLQLEKAKAELRLPQTSNVEFSWRKFGTGYLADKHHWRATVTPSEKQASWTWMVRIFGGHTSFVLEEGKTTTEKEGMEAAEKRLCTWVKELSGM
jgi:hypothetical protein